MTRAAALPPRTYVKGLIVLLSFVAIAYLLQSLGEVTEETWIDQHVRGQGVHGHLIYLAVGGLATAVGLPRQGVAFLGGYAFGALLGTVLGVAATVIGCVFTFLYARVIGRSFVERRFSNRIGRVDAFLADNPFSMTLLIRLLPLGSNLVTNLVAGVTSVRMLPFVLASAIGYVPQTLVFALAGKGVRVDTEYRILLSAVLFLGSGLLGVYLYRRFRRGKSVDESPDHALDGDDR